MPDKPEDVFTLDMLDAVVREAKFSAVRSLPYDGYMFFKPGTLDQQIKDWIELGATVLHTEAGPVIYCSEGRYLMVESSYLPTKSK